MRQPDRLRRVLLRRFIELMREVGALLMAFAPLDAVLISEQVEAVTALAAAFGLGLLFWTGSVIMEWFVGVYEMGDRDEN